MIAGLPSPFESFVATLFARLTAKRRASTALMHCPSCGHRHVVALEPAATLIAEEPLRLPPPSATPSLESRAQALKVIINDDPATRPNRDHLISVIPELEMLDQRARARSR